MKADLYTAQARTAGSRGLAHRTAAGFVVLTSADGDDLIALIDAKQNESDLVDQVVAKAHADAPTAFAMLFTAGGDLYVIASGAVVASIASATTNLTVSAAPGKVLVHQMSAGISETAANIRLRIGDIPADAVTELDLKDGTVEANWVELAVGGATIAVTTPQASTPVAEPAAVPEPPTPTAAPPVVPPTPPAIPEPPTPPAAPPVVPPTPPAIPEPPTPPAAPPVVPPTPPAIPEPPTPPAAPPVVPPTPPAIPEPPTPPAAPPVVPLTPPVAAMPAGVAAPPAPPVVPPTPPSVPEPPAAPGAPAPSAEDPAEDPAKVGAVMVLGISCSQGHHNHPDAVYCSQCGTKMGVHHTTVLMNGPRPPLGVLVVDDGTTYSLSTDLVIGREPTSHDDVIAGTATPMVLTDDTLSLSRRHARIVLEDWSVAVRDLNSSNGTFLSRSGQTESWTQLESGSTVPLEPGDRLRIGGRIVQVELHHVR